MSFSWLCQVIYTRWISFVFMPKTILFLTLSDCLFERWIIDLKKCIWEYMYSKDGWHFCSQARKMTRSIWWAMANGILTTLPMRAEVTWLHLFYQIGKEIKRKLLRRLWIGSKIFFYVTLSIYYLTNWEWHSGLTFWDWMRLGVHGNSIRI